MKVKPYQINWHEQQAIYSAHFQPGNTGRLVTGGGDYNVRIWQLIKKENDLPKVIYMSTLKRHTGTVNVVRFSPKGDILATAGDDGFIILWKLDGLKEINNKKLLNLESDDSDSDHEQNFHKPIAILRGSLAEIYDLSWSPNGDYIVSGSMDNTARVWNVKEAKCVYIFIEHQLNVQGVAWDPLGEFIATQGNDRSVNIYSYEIQANGMFTVKHLTTVITDPFTTPVRNSNSSSPKQQQSVVQKKLKRSFRIYCDNCFKCFFRRLTFTPDGALLITPSGQYQTDLFNNDDSEEEEEKLLLLSGNGIVIKCSPILYKLRNFPTHLHSPSLSPLSPSISPLPSKINNNMNFSSNSQQQPSTSTSSPLFAIPYRMIYAVATEDTLFIYDTQQYSPLVMASKLHYRTLTDLAWSDDGNTLVVTSFDGYCSIVTFEEGELGERYLVVEEKSEFPNNVVGGTNLETTIDRH
nr:13736_t:CDS:10 [Entrophospora candida]